MDHVEEEFLFIERLLKMSGWGVLTELCFSCWLHGNGINKNGRYY